MRDFTRGLKEAGPEFLAGDGPVDPRVKPYLDAYSGSLRSRAVMTAMHASWNGVANPSMTSLAVREPTMPTAATLRESHLE